MSDIILSRSFGTHNGSFHADEVTACALLIKFKLIDRDKIIRSRDESKLSHLEYVCDVGGLYDPAQKRFDHHQKEYDGNLSSAGMILQYLYDEKVIDKGMYKYLNQHLVHGIDEIDNGLITPSFGHCSFSAIIAYFVPSRYDALENEFSEGFDRSLDFTLWLIDQMIEKYVYLEECKEIVAKEMEKKESFLFFNHAMPWLEPFFDLGGENHPAQFVIMPTGTQWKLRAIPPSYQDRMKVRKPLPEKWAGLFDEKLKQETQISGAIFCHKGRFISVWETREDALKALEEVLK